MKSEQANPLSFDLNWSPLVRWVVLLPATFLVFVAVNLLTRLAFFVMGVTPGGPTELFRWLGPIVQSGVAIYYSTRFAARLAPGRPRGVAYFLGSFHLLVSIVSPVLRSKQGEDPFELDYVLMGVANLIGIVSGVQHVVHDLRNAEGT